MFKKIHIYLLLFAVLLSCSKKDEIVPVKSAEKSITLFTLNSFSPAVKANIDSIKYTITASVPIGTDITKLSPTITISKLASISPSSGTVQDFTSPVVYTVTAENGTVQTYTVKVNIAKSSSKSITSFTFNNLPKSIITIDSIKKTITATISERTDLTKLVPTIITSNKASVNPVSGQAQDFTNPVTYTVSAEDGTTQSYLVTVNTTFTYKNAAYFVNGTTLFAINLTTGDINWTFEISTNGNSHRSAPTVKNGIIYVWSTDTYFYAIDANTGILKWKYKTIYNNTYSYKSSPIITNGIVYFCDGDYFEGNIYAVDINTGTLKWTFKTNLNLNTNPTVVDGVLYIGAISNNSYMLLYALDALTGIKKWEYRLNGDLRSNVSVVNGIVYFGLETKVYALNASNGIIKWVKDIFVDGFSYAFANPSSPTIADGILYITDGYSGNLHALDAVTGTVKWRNSFTSTSFSSPIVSNGLVYVGTNEKGILAIDTKTGIQKWKFPSNNSFQSSSPVIANGVLYIGNTNYYPKPNLYAVDALKGTLIWSFSPSNKSNNQMSDLCIVDSNGQIYHSSESGEQQ